MCKPQKGEIILMNKVTGVVVDIYENAEGKAILRVQTPRNVYRKLGPDLIDFEVTH